MINIIFYCLCSSLALCSIETHKLHLDGALWRGSFTVCSPGVTCSLIALDFAQSTLQPGYFLNGILGLFNSFFTSTASSRGLIRDMASAELDIPPLAMYLPFLTLFLLCLSSSSRSILIGVYHGIVHGQFAGFYKLIKSSLCWTWWGMGSARKVLFY